MCESISVSNRWLNGTLSRVSKYNGRHAWVDETKRFAIWYDGQRGAFFDWMFGYAQRIGSSSQRHALMFSHEETICPQNVTTWTNDNSANLTCISEITTKPTTSTTSTKTATTSDDLTGPCRAQCPPGKDGLNGVPGAAGENGPPGLQGPPGEDGEDGRPGEDGLPGIPGEDGRRGEFIQGPPGVAGKNGSPGVQGAPGDAGKPGVHGKDAVINREKLYEITKEIFAAMLIEHQGIPGEDG